MVWGGAQDGKLCAGSLGPLGRRREADLRALSPDPWCGVTVLAVGRGRRGLGSGAPLDGGEMGKCLGVFSGVESQGRMFLYPASHQGV